MSIFSKKVEYVDPVEEARTAVAEALGSFQTARDTLVAATETFAQQVQENDQLVRSLEARNVELLTEADRAARVGDKLGELIV